MQCSVHPHHRFASPPSPSRSLLVPFTFNASPLDRPLPAHCPPTCPPALPVQLQYSLIPPAGTTTASFFSLFSSLSLLCLGILENVFLSHVLLSALDAAFLTLFSAGFRFCTDLVLCRTNSLRFDFSLFYSAEPNTGKKRDSFAVLLLPTRRPEHPIALPSLGY